MKRRSFLSGLVGSAALAGSRLMAQGAAGSARIRDPQKDRNTKNSGPELRSAVSAASPARMKRVLAIGDVHTGYQHDSVSHALATIERLGRESGLFVTSIRTDTQLVTKSPVYGTGKYAAPPTGTRGTNARNLNFFDAIFFYGLGEESLTDNQKLDLISFIYDDGKGFIGAHSAIDAFYNWPEYGEMIGGYFDNHPWGVVNASILIEEPSFPAMSQFSQGCIVQDEIYVVTEHPFSREKVDVLARLDPGKIDLKTPELHRTDRDFPVAWVKKYGLGNVFYSTFGHTDAAWDDPRIQHMYLEAIKWSLGLTQYTPRPHSIRQQEANSTKSR